MKKDKDLVLAYHERAKKMGMALNEKHNKRSKLIDKAKGMDGLSLEQQFTYEDLDAAGKAVKEILNEVPGVEMDVLQDLAGERAVVRADVVLAAIWEEVGKGNLKLAPGVGVELTESGREID